MIFCLVVVKIRCNIEAPDVALLALKKMSTKNGPVLDIIPLRFMLQIFHTNDNRFKVIILTSRQETYYILGNTICSFINGRVV